MNQDTLVAVLVGAAITMVSTTVAEWIRYSLTRRQLRDDRWEDFQHDSLVALSDQLAIIRSSPERSVKGLHARSVRQSAAKATGAGATGRRRSSQKGSMFR